MYLPVLTFHGFVPIYIKTKQNKINMRTDKESSGNDKIKIWK